MTDTPTPDDRYAEVAGLPPLVPGTQLDMPAMRLYREPAIYEAVADGDGQGCYIVTRDRGHVGQLYLDQESLVDMLGKLSAIARNQGLGLAPTPGMVLPKLTLPPGVNGHGAG